MKTISYKYIVIILAAVCFAREPECSRFHYEQKLLEKVIRSEIRMEAFGDLLKEAPSSMDVQMQKITGFGYHFTEYSISEAVCFTREPECSRFHYEEKLLEKVIRSEIRMESFTELLKKTTDYVEENRHTIKALSNTVQELQKEIHTLKSIDVKSSGLYTRWGRRSCPESTELVYEGFAGGGHFNEKGASSNYICLPKDPIFDRNGQKAGSVSKVYGAEYETSDSTFHTSLHDEDVPCALCRVVGRSIVIIPARNACYSGWHTEYSGYLMSSFYGHEGNKELVCMDGNPEKADGSDNGSQNGALFYFAHAFCGSLKCPPYSKNKALLCVVCSK